MWVMGGGPEGRPGIHNSRGSGQKHNNWLRTSCSHHSWGKYIPLLFPESNGSKKNFHRLDLSWFLWDLTDSEGGMHQSWASHIIQDSLGDCFRDRRADSITDLGLDARDCSNEFIIIWEPHKGFSFIHREVLPGSDIPYPFRPDGSRPDNMPLCCLGFVVRSGPTILHRFSPYPREIEHPEKRKIRNKSPFSTLR